MIHRVWILFALYVHPDGTIELDGVRHYPSSNIIWDKIQCDHEVSDYQKIADSGMRNIKFFCAMQDLDEM